METTQYKYSTKQTVYAILLFLGLIAFGCYEIETDAPADVLWKIMIPFVVLFGALLLYICYKYLRPLLGGETILELDNFKLYYRITDATIYWKDVASIDYTTGSRSTSWSIRFYMKDGSKTRTITTLYVKGPDHVIYNTVIGYFQKYR